MPPSSKKAGTSQTPAQAAAKWKQFTDETASAMASATTDCASGTYADTATSVQVNECGAFAWSLQTAQIAHVNLDNLNCANVDIGVDVHRAPQNACCVMGRVHAALSSVILSHQFSDADRNNFWLQLFGSAVPTPTPWDTATVSSLLETHLVGLCDGSAQKFQSAFMEDVLFAGSSKTSCGMLSAAVNSLSSTVVCVLGKVAGAQRKAAPASFTPDPAANVQRAKVLRTILIVLACLAALALVGFVVGWVQHKRSTAAGLSAALVLDA
jgi:hypothetical protein